jgi:hypothetical protein
MAKIDGFSTFIEDLPLAHLHCLWSMQGRQQDPLSRERIKMKRRIVYQEIVRRSRYLALSGADAEMADQIKHEYEMFERYDT